MNNKSINCTLFFKLNKCGKKNPKRKELEREIVENNLDLIKRRAEIFIDKKKNNIELGDLIGMGVIGLYKAVKEYKGLDLLNHKSGTPYSYTKYLIDYIDEEMLNYRIKCSGLIRKGILSIYQPINDEGDILGESIKSNQLNIKNSRGIINKKKFYWQIDELLESLSPREEKLLRMVYGIGESYDYTFAEIGRSFKISGSRVIQIANKSIKKLRHPSKSRPLRSYFEN